MKAAKVRELLWRTNKAIEAQLYLVASATVLVPWIESDEGAAHRALLPMPKKTQSDQAADETLMAKLRADIIANCEHDEPLGPPSDAQDSRCPGCRQMIET